jgi:hypothetical protein
VSKKNDINNLSFDELRTNFIANLYSYNDELELKAGEKLHDLMPSIEDIIPLLHADNKSSVCLGAYIAQQQGDRAKLIFPLLKTFLKSEYAGVRRDVIDCFYDCDARAEDYLEILPMINDTESVRLFAISAFRYLDTDKMIALHECTKSSDNRNFENALSIYVEFLREEIGVSNLFSLSKSGTKLTKVFSYLAIFKKHGVSDELQDYVDIANDRDLVRDYEIYTNVAYEET